MSINRSTRVRAVDFSQEWYRNRAAELSPIYQSIHADDPDLWHAPPLDFGLESGRLHRKAWEFCIIAQVFRDWVEPAIKRQQATKTKSTIAALGFGCGREPLPRWLADNMIDVIATDAPGSNPAWTKTGQHAKGLSDLGLDTSDRVTFREVDMRAIDEDLLDSSFDFTWSCGSFEHIGGIDAGIRFFCDQMRCLKPGGIACHTTELNIDLDSSVTIDNPDLCLFRLRDLETLAGKLWAQGDRLWEPDLHRGATVADLFVDNPPYRSDQHLNIAIGSVFATTSVLLIATKGDSEVISR